MAKSDDKKEGGKRPAARRAGEGARAAKPSGTKAASGSKSKPPRATIPAKPSTIKRGGAGRSTSTVPPTAAANVKKEPTYPPPGQSSAPDAYETIAEADGLPEGFEPDTSRDARPIESTPPGSADVPGELFDIERKLDRLLRDAGTLGGDPVARRRAAEALNQIAARLGASSGVEDDPDDPNVLNIARELFSTDYYLKQWGRLAMRNRSEEVDDFGLDPTYEARVQPLFNLFYKKYFRVETHGIERVPSTGRTLLVANHGGTLPWDGAMLKTAFKLEHSAHRELRWLAEDFVFHFPFLGAFMNRIGAVRACQENAERLLKQEKLVGVFPEGIKGIGKLYKHRYQLQRFGRGGYIKLALRTGAPIIPTAVVGSEDAHPLLFKFTYLAKAMGIPYIPVTPTFPALGPAGLIPFPTRWKIIFGEPLDLSSYGPDAAQDAILVNRLNEKVRGTIQQMLDDATAR